MSLPAGLVIDRHLLAGITLVGMFLDILGALYLAYDLLGARFGFLRGLTQALTFGVVACVVFAVGLGSVAWAMAGLRVGLLGVLGGGTIGLIPGTVIAATVYGLRLELNGGFTNGLKAAIAGALAGTLGGGLMFGVPGILVYLPAGVVVCACAFGTRGGLRGGLVGALITTFIVGAAATVTENLATGLLYGPVLGVAAGIMSGPGRHIKTWTDNLPERQMGAAGVILIFAGFLIQSVQYWVVVLNVAVR